MRNTAEKRHNDWKKAIRKRKIMKAFGDENYYDNLHQYSKNKIHCSCPICSAKSKGKKAKRLPGPAKNWSIADEKRIEEMEEQMMED